MLLAKAALKNLAKATRAATICPRLKLDAHCRGLIRFRHVSAHMEVTINGSAVPVTAAGPHIDLARVTSCVPFKDWSSTIDRSLTVKKVHVTDVDYFGSRVGFLKFRAEVQKDGVFIPGIVFMRGGAVSIMPVLQCGGQKFVLCCRQPRAPIGHAAFLEIPAGMLDGDGHFSGVAAKEMKEETGLEIKDDELIDLTALAYGLPGGAKDTHSVSDTGVRGMYPSVGACDEFLRLLYWSKDVSQAELDGLRGKATGNMEEGELITLEIVPYDELWRKAPDAKTLCSILLLERLQAAGLVPK